MMENIEVWQVYIFDGHSMHFSLAKNSINCKMLSCVSIKKTPENRSLSNHIYFAYFHLQITTNLPSFNCAVILPSIFPIKLLAIDNPSPVLDFERERSAI